MPLIPPTGGRLVIGQPDAEVIGLVDGVPVTADQDGAGRMHEITHLVTDIHIVIEETNHE